MGLQEPCRLFPWLFRQLLCMAMRTVRRGVRNPLREAAGKNLRDRLFFLAGCLQGSVQGDLPWNS